MLEQHISLASWFCPILYLGPITSRESQTTGAREGDRDGVREQAEASCSKEDNLCFAWPSRLSPSLMAKMAMRRTWPLHSHRSPKLKVFISSLNFSYWGLAGVPAQRTAFSVS